MQLLRLGLPFQLFLIKTLDLWETNFRHINHITLSSSFAPYFILSPVVLTLPCSGSMPSCWRAADVTYEECRMFLSTSCCSPVRIHRINMNLCDAQWMFIHSYFIYWFVCQHISWNPATQYFTRTYTLPQTKWTHVVPTHAYCLRIL